MASKTLQKHDLRKSPTRGSLDFLSQPVKPRLQNPRVSVEADHNWNSCPLALYGIFPNVGDAWLPSVIVLNGFRSSWVRSY